MENGSYSTGRKLAISIKKSISKVMRTLRTKKRRITISLKKWFTGNMSKIE